MAAPGLFKGEIRSAVKSLLRRVSEEDVRRASAWVSSELLNSPVWRFADSVCIYHPIFPWEMCMRSVSLAGLMEGKGVFYPVWDRRDGVLEMVSPFGGASCPTGNILVVCPGLAFTPAGDRMGYGGGFYDRWFDKNRDKVMYTVAPCFRQQIVPFIPCDTFDIPVDHVLVYPGS